MTFEQYVFMIVVVALILACFGPGGGDDGESYA
jgi:hypothetical protein